MSRYVLSPKAQADIDGIWDYTADIWNIEQADRYVDRIKRACESISPDGREGRLLTEVREGYRKVAVGSHFIIFRIVEDTIDVVRILHQKMDIPSHLQFDE